MANCSWNNVRRNLKMVCRLVGIPHYVLSELSGYGVHYISDFLRGRYKSVSVEFLDFVSDYFGIPVDWFFVCHDWRLDNIWPKV